MRTIIAPEDQFTSLNYKRLCVHAHSQSTAEQKIHMVRSMENRKTSNRNVLDLHRDQGRNEARQGQLLKGGVIWKLTWGNQRQIET